MPKRTPKPRRRKLPPGVTDLAAVREVRRVAACNAAAREFAKLSPEERQRQLIEMLTITVKMEKKPDE